MYKHKTAFKLIILFFFNMFLTLSVFAQNNSKKYNLKCSSPLKKTMSLSGDFGEIRSDHFHMGADIRLRTGQPVYAVADGYLYRYKTEPGGYGNVLYINHKDGFRSVYCHLNRFREDIHNYVRKEQLKSDKFKVEGYPAPEIFPVKKGDLIGFGGNTGYSFGPHLHFEMRYSKNDVAINPYHFLSFPQDYRKPEVRALLVKSADENSGVNGKEQATIYKLRASKNHLIPTGRIEAFGRVKLSVMTVDRRSNQHNSYALYGARLFVNNSLIFEFKKDEIPFEKTRCINSFIDYKEYKKARKKFTNLYREKNNNLAIYGDFGDGYIDIKNNEKKKIRIELFDFNGNTTTVKFLISGKLSAKKKETVEACKHKMYAGKNNYFIQDDFRLMTSENAFYDDFCLHYKKQIANDDFFSDWHNVWGDFTPIHEGVDIAIRTKNIDENLLPKTCIVRKKSDGELVNVGGKLLNGFMTAKVSSFGKYAVYLDTIPPHLTPKNFSAKTKSYNLKKYIKFKVEDNMSKVVAYKAMLNGEKTVAHYDLKNDLINIEVPAQIKYKDVNLHLEVFDAKGNVAVYNHTFKME